jgi:hypothetical protein
MIRAQADRSARRLRRSLAAGVIKETATKGASIYEDSGHLRASFVRDHIVFLDEAFTAPQNAAVALRAR